MPPLSWIGLRAASPSKLNNTVNNKSIFNTKCPSFSRPYLYIQPPPQSPPKVHFSYLQLSSVNLPHFRYFHLPIPLLLVHKIILTISTNTPFLYTTAIFYLPIFVYSPTSTSKLFSLPRPYIYSYIYCFKVSRSKGVLWGLTLFRSLSSSSNYRQG